MLSSQSVSARGLVLGFNDGTMGLVAVTIMLIGAVFWSAHEPNVEKTDFALTYVGAQILHQGQSRHLYDVTLQKQLRDSLFPHSSPLLFEHPPFEALLLSPLASLSLQTVYSIWGLLNVAIWVALTVFLRVHLPWPREELGYFALWLLFAPIGVALYQGQSSLILLAIYAITFVLLKQKRELLAGIALGFGLLKFQFVLPFAFILLLSKRWRFLLGLLNTSLMLLALALAAVGWQGVKEYARFLGKIESDPQNLSYGSAVDMPTIYGFVHATLGRRMSIAELNILVALSSLLLLGWLALRRKSAGDAASYELIFASALAASLVTGVHMFTHDFSPLLLPLFLVAARMSNLKSAPGTHRGLRWAMAATLLLFWLFPVYFLLVGWHCMYLMCPVLVLFSCLAVETAQYLGRQRHTVMPCLAAE